MSGFETLAETLAGMGHTLEARTRLTFGKDVAAALASLETGGIVVIVTEGATDEKVAQYNEAIVTETSRAALIDARTHAYGKVRPNVATFLKSRKIRATVTPPVKDVDGNAYAFLVRKSG